MPSNKFNPSFRAVITALALFIIAVRLISLPFPDLVDTTEGRYAGVAQIMLDRNDWVTPWIHYEGINQPYLGKPPLHFWLVQTSFLLFGQNNFAARFPGVLSGIGIGTALWFGAISLLGMEAALVTVAVFASSCMTFFLSGAVVLDVTLTLGVTIALICLVQIERSKLTGHLAFAGLALAVLTKGPLAGVLVGCVALPWAVGHRLLLKRWPTQLSKVPWITGTALFLALVVPWYIWAEIRNPGFLHYFIFNENLGRYFSKDYVDEYGSGHRQPFGTGFLMMLLAVFPWSFILLAALAPRVKSIFSKQTLGVLSQDSTLLFAICWTLSCPVLLLGATQYTGTYLMPSVPGFALLIGVLWDRHLKRADTSAIVIKTLHLREILVYATGILIAAWIIISLASLWFIPNIPSIIVSLGLAGWVAISFRAFLRSSQEKPNAETKQTTSELPTSELRYHNQPLGMVLMITLICATVYGAATFCFNNSLSANRSSRRAIETAKLLNTMQHPLRIGFPYYFPFSAWFYRPLVLDSEDQVIAVKDGELATADVDLFIVRKRTIDRLKAELPDAREIGAVGQWRIFVRQ